jgi:hypothetical protein
MRELVRRNLKRRNPLPGEDADLTRIINQKIREDICADHYWSFQETIVEINTVAGTDLYSWPFPEQIKDCRWIAIREAADGEFVELDEDDEISLIFDRCNTEQGVPDAWARTGKAFRLQPIPDSSDYTLKLKIWKYPAPLVDDADTNDFLLYWSQLVEYGVTARASLYWGESPSDAAVWEQKYREELGKAISTDRRAQAAANRTLGISHAAGRRADKRRTGVRIWRR